jgi:hypothetical protein
MTGRGPIAWLGLALALVTWASASAQTAATPSVTAPRLVPPVAGPSADSVAEPAYERKGRRDPFQPVENLQAEMTAPAVASARLRGILRGRETRALIETPDGLGYILKVGDTLADGRLIEIAANSVVFSVPGRRGSTNRIVLRLPED